MENSYGYPPEGYDSLSMLTQAADAMSASKEQSTTMSNLQNQNEGYDQYQLPDVTYENSTSMSETHAPQMHGAYHPSILSARNMEAFVFGPGSQGGRGYGYHSAAVGPQGYYGNDLGILNAESYDDGSGAMRAQAEFDARAMVAEQDQTMPFGLKGAPRQVKKEKEFLEAESGNGKRKRKVKNEPVSTDVQDEIDGGEDDEDVRKKTRGRPRVDTKDETPAERRRTQIRLAQRAYRNRKETTISSLEKRVQDLRGTNEEMSSIFISLYDFAVSKGILGREPELARQLQSATERFVSLASTATNDDSNTEENASGENQKQGPEQDFNRRVRGRVAAPEQAQQQISPPVSEAAANPWGGYTLADSAIPFQEGDFQYRPAQAGRSDVQIITRPTEDNASFPFDFMGLGQFRTEDLGVENPGVKDFPQLYTARAGTDLPPPSSFAFTEVSFARRIHRDTTEAALRLANLKSPPKTKYQRVFGITAMYETNDAIVIRLKRVLAATSKDTLQQWKEPFVHLGGAGTFYPMSETDRNSDLMPKFQSGYSMGPFSSDVCRVNDLIQQDMTFNLPGFEGDFFDANDVEGYLRARGVEIPPAADFYCAEIDLTSFGDIPSRQNSNTDSSLFAPNTPHNSMDNILVNPQSDANSMFMGISKSAADPNLPYDQGQAAWDANALGMQGSVISDFNSINKQSANPGYQVSTSSKSVYSPRSIVTINVRTFIAGIALYRALLAQCSRIVLPADLPSQGVSNPIKHLIRKGFRQYVHCTSPNILVEVLKRTYKAEELLRAAGNGDKSSLSAVHTYLWSLHQQRSNARATCLPPPPRSEKPRPRVWPYPGARKLLETLPVPKERLTGKRGLPKLAAANGVPFLRTTKPQSEFLGRVLRDKAAQKSRRFERLREMDEAIDAGGAEEDWGRLVEEALREEAALAKERGDEKKEKQIMAWMRSDEGRSLREDWTSGVASIRRWAYGNIMGEQRWWQEMGKRMGVLADQEKALWQKEKAEEVERKFEDRRKRIADKEGPGKTYSTSPKGI